MKTIAVVPLFLPEETVLEHMRVALEQVDEVVLVDDSGTPEPTEVVTSLEETPRVHLIRNTSNIGQASTLNTGVRAALGHGANYILTLDQDTLPLRPGYVAALRTHLRRAQRADIDTLIAAPDSKPTENYAWGHEIEGAFEFCSTNPVQSGLLIDARAFERYGFFRDELFIDGVDVEFLLRMHHGGSHTLITPGAYLDHDIGEPTWVFPRLRRIRLSNHSTARRYYMTRNSLILAREYKQEAPWFAKGYLNYVWRLNIKAVLFEKQRGKKLWAMLRGVWDGFR